MSVSRPDLNGAKRAGKSERTNERKLRSQCLSTPIPRLWRRYKYAERYKNTSTH
jgi:hypothetical protein